MLCFIFFGFFIYLGLLANAREPWGGRFKTIEKPACSEVATFLFCFFIYLGLLAALVNLGEDASKPLKSDHFVVFLFLFLAIHPSKLGSVLK
jgi:hypothetical protein